MDTPQKQGQIQEQEAFRDTTPLLRSSQLSFSGSSYGANRPTRDSSGNVPRKRSIFRERAATLLQHLKKAGQPPIARKSVQAILLASYLNVFLVCIPISWALNYALPSHHTLIFVFSFLAIIPLAKLLAFATDELSLRVGQTLAGLMNATLGNAIELIISIIGLTKCELSIVQSSLVGSILSNLLLVLGTCFFAGGLKFSEQGFALIAAQMNTSLLTISVIAVLLPSAFVMALSGSSDEDSAFIHQQILAMSHGVAIILMSIYAFYLFFQLFSHKTLYQDDSQDILKSKKYGGNPFEFGTSSGGLTSECTARPLSSSPLFSPQLQGQPSVAGNATVNAIQSTSDPESGNIASTQRDEEELQMSIAMSFGLLVIVTVLVAVTADFLVDSIDGLAETGMVSKEFIGVILLPIVGNAAEHVTAVMVSVKDKLTLSISVAVGSSIQIALFVIPFSVTLGWILDKPLSLLFDPLLSIVLFLSVLTVNYVIQDGKSNWLEGMILLCLYLIICITFWYYPGTPSVLSC
ncbi:Calcium/proton exchanger [Chiua virens]|nr:Calcium/proton exchanger [Chiua virens]